MRNSLKIGAIALLILSCSQPKSTTSTVPSETLQMDEITGFRSLNHRLAEPITITRSRLVKGTALVSDSSITVTPIVEIEGKWYVLGLSTLKRKEALSINYKGTHYLMLSGRSHVFARRVVFWDAETIHLEEAISL
jgi:hypothetical protein